MPQNTLTPNNTYCCIESCGSRARRETDLSYHNFPKFGKNKVNIVSKNGKCETVDVLTAWLKATKHEHTSKLHMRVCSLHFDDKDFYSSALSPLAKRRKLRSTAVPSRFLDHKPEVSLVSGQLRKQCHPKPETTILKKKINSAPWSEEPKKKVKQETNFEVETIPHFTFVDVEANNAVVISDEETNGVEETTNNSRQEPLTLPKSVKQPTTRRKPALNTTLTLKEEPKEPEYIDLSAYSDLEVKITKRIKEYTDDEFDIKGKKYAEKLRQLIPQQRILVESILAEILSQAMTNKLKSHILNFILEK